MAEKKLTLDILTAKIAEKNLRWKATENRVSQLSPEMRKKRLGLVPTTAEMGLIKKLGLHTETESRHLGRPVKLGAPVKGVAASIDWRPYGTKIRDQGDCGACVAFGTLGVLEALLKIHYYKDQKKDVNLSEAHLFFCGGGSCDDGWHPKNACAYLKKNGVPDEACFPYKDSTMDCSRTCTDWKKRTDHTKIASFGSSKTIATLKKRLSTNGPQISGIAVYTDFFSYKSGVYQHVSGKLEGYHCIGVFGYNDADRCWICRNSWNTDWGEAGWFRIGYGECGIEDAFGMFNMVVSEK